MECTQSVPLLNRALGVRLQIEPCKEPAFAQVSYKALSDWESAGRVESGGEPMLFNTGMGMPMPLGTWGLFIAVSVTGTRGDLSIEVHLSACIAGRCDGDVSLIGGALTAAGFPFQLYEFDHLKFDCPEEHTDKMVMIIAIVIGCLVLCGAGGAAFAMAQKKKREANRGSRLNEGPIVTGVVTGVVTEAGVALQPPTDHQGKQLVAHPGTNTVADQI